MVVSFISLYDFFIFDMLPNMLFAPMHAPGIRETSKEIFAKRRSNLCPPASCQRNVGGRRSSVNSYEKSTM